MSFPISSLGISFLGARDCLSCFSVLTLARLITITSHREQELGEESPLSQPSLTVVPMATTVAGQRVPLLPQS